MANDTANDVGKKNSLRRQTEIYAAEFVTLVLAFYEGINVPNPALLKKD